MTLVEFNYYGKKTKIQSTISEKIKNLIHNYSNQINKEKTNLYFSYNGKEINQLNEELTLEEISSSEDINNNKMTIFVFPKELKNKNKEEEHDIIKSNDIICPKCGESIRIDIIDYKINLSECKNGHKIDNILLNEFENSQKIHKTSIMCDICKKYNKSISDNNIFYKCLTCKKKICLFCKSNHDKLHIIINYHDKNYICAKHNQKYNSYCKNCKNNICKLCEEEHNSHIKIIFEEIMIDRNELIKTKKELKEHIDLFNNNVKIIIGILNEVIEKMNIYYRINEYIINSYNNKRLNYEILYNLKKIKFNNIIDDLKNVIEENYYKNKFTSIFNIYNKMNINEITLIYDNSKKEKIIKIFGEDFVGNNKNNCKIIYKGEEYSLGTKFKLKNIIEDKLKIKLKGIMNISNMCWMFNDCPSLLSLPDISKWDTSNVTNMNFLFGWCSLLKTLPDISNWNISNVTDISYIFSGCSSLLSLPDISKWNTSNVRNISYMFSGCTSLLTLPDISKWNTSKVKNMEHMFSHCLSLKILPDISKWDISDVADIKSMFNECVSLLCLPDISNWNIINVNSISSLFSGCLLLSNLPDISKWNTSNVIDMSKIFNKCKSLISLPDISKWNTINVTDMNSMFSGCSSLSSTI